MVGLPHRFADRSAVADVLAAHEDLEPGASSGTHYRLAGRVLGRRGMGKAAFLDLEDRSGRIQLMASADGLGPQYESLTDVNLGDIVGVSGEAGAEPSRRAVAAARLLPAARALRARCPTSTTASPTSRRAIASATSTC